MSAGVDSARGLRTARESSRRWLPIFASSATVFSVLHHVDHVARGNHSGWPFQAKITPFTFSLLIYVLILPGIYLTARGRHVGGYHLFVAVTGLALLGTVHFAPTDGRAGIADTRHLHGLRESCRRDARADDTDRPHDQRGAPGDNRLRLRMSPGQSSTRPRSS